MTQMASHYGDNAQVISELSFDEIDMVDGGLAPIVIGLLIVGGGAVIAFAAGVAAGYLAN
jgi:lactobin A/cerein 7B family class IIb bacteriocin